MYNLLLIIQSIVFYLKKQNTCGDSTWAAAGNTLKRKKNLDETGLEILGCRHGTAQAAVNMFFGEIYGYAHYLQREYLLNRNADFIWSDVMCKYWPWVQKNDASATSTMKPALSVMHVKAHSWSCQVRHTLSGLAATCIICLACHFGQSLYL